MKRDDSDLECMKKQLRRLSSRGPVRDTHKEPDTSLKRVQSKRKRQNSKTKGNSYENRIAKKFAHWSGLEIKRTPSSGGWGTAAFGVTGDLVCTSKKFPFHVECKKREGWTLDDLIIGVRKRDTRSIIAWWLQCINSCPKNKIPALVFARNHLPDLLMLKRTDYGSLFKVGDFTRDLIPHFVFNMDEYEVVIIALDDFFLRVRPPKGCKHRKKWVAGSAGDLIKIARDKNDNTSSED